MTTSMNMKASTCWFLTRLSRFVSIVGWSITMRQYLKKLNDVSLLFRKRRFFAIQNKTETPDYYFEMPAKAYAY